MNLNGTKIVVSRDVHWTCRRPSLGAPAEISFRFTACNEPERTGDMCVAHRSRKEHRKDRGFFVRRYTWIVGCKRKRRDETQEADILLQRRSSQLADLSQQKSGQENWA